LFYRALVRGLRGDVDDARRLSAEGLQLAESMEDRFTATQHRSLLGFVELSVGNAASAHGYLGPLPAELDEMGIGEPGAFPFVWDDVEALMALGRFAEAERIVARLAERAASLDRAWMQGLAARTSALLAAGAGDLEAALGATERSLALLSRTTYPFDHARALLLQGEIHRRAKRKRAARDSLAAALWIFEDLGARLWAERARAELARVGARAVGPTALTPTEQRVAELAGKGKTNRQIADELFVSVKTVEANMSRVLHKLGVSSRRELVDMLDRSSDGNA
jgi:DNA-binding CsgD family transcriptional regulator